MSNEYDFAPLVDDGPGVVESTARGFIGSIPFSNPIQAAVRAGAGQLGIPFIGSEPKDKKETFKQQYNRLAREEALINDQARENNPYAYYPGMVGGAALGGYPFTTALGRIAQLGINAAGVSTNKPEDSWSDQGLSALQAAGIGAVVGGLGEVGKAAGNAIGRKGYEFISKYPIKPPETYGKPIPEYLDNAIRFESRMNPWHPERKMTPAEWWVNFSRSGIDKGTKKTLNAGFRNRLWQATKEGLGEMASLGAVGAGGYATGAAMDYLSPNNNFKYAHAGALLGLGGKAMFTPALKPVGATAAAIGGKFFNSDTGLTIFQNAVRSGSNANIQSNKTPNESFDDEYDFAPIVKQNEISGKISK